MACIHTQSEPVQRGGVGFVLLTSSRDHELALRKLSAPGRALLWANTQLSVGTASLPVSCSMDECVSQLEAKIRAGLPTLQLVGAESTAVF